MTDFEEQELAAIDIPIHSDSQVSIPHNDTLSYATITSASRPLVSSSASRPINPNDLHYKDQTRSVNAIPLVNVLPPSIIDAHLQGSADNSEHFEALVTVVATPVDNIDLYEFTGTSGGSASTRRPVIDP